MSFAISPEFFAQPGVIPGVLGIVGLLTLLVLAMAVVLVRRNAALRDQQLAFADLQKDLPLIAMKM